MTTKNKTIPQMFLRPKPIKKVTRAVLEKIADGIYNPKTGAYINLCSGTLQSGPDPSCKTKVMHCGLGELYWAITGHQPEEDSANESRVVETVASRSVFRILYKDAKHLDLPLATLYRVSYNNMREDFEGILNNVPYENDSIVNFKTRAKRVANQLREAAKLLK